MQALALSGLFAETAERSVTGHLITISDGYCMTRCYFRDPSNTLAAEHANRRPARTLLETPAQNRSECLYQFRHLSPAPSQAVPFEGFHTLCSSRLFLGFAARIEVEMKNRDANSEADFLVRCTELFGG
jgi:hypothetical protein